jgi:hypothetical protein
MSSRFSALDLAVPGSDSVSTVIAQDDSGSNQVVTIPKLSDAVAGSVVSVKTIAGESVIWGYAPSSEFVGPRGVKGDKGDQGIQGIPGAQGIPGVGFTYKQPTPPPAPVDGDIWVEGVSVGGNTGHRMWSRRGASWVSLDDLVTGFQRGYSNTPLTVDVAAFDTLAGEAFVEQVSFRYATSGTINAANFWLASLQLIRTNGGAIAATTLATAELNNGNASFGSQFLPIEMLAAPVYAAPGFAWLRLVFTRSGNPGQLLVSGCTKTKRFR